MFDCSDSVSSVAQATTSTAVASCYSARAELLDVASDAELGQALIDGHPDAPRVAWRRFLPLVQRLVRRSLGSRGENEDVAQTVFLCFFRRVHTLRDPIALRAFVIGVTLRVAREEARKRRKLCEKARQAAEPLDNETLGAAANAIPQLAFSKLHALVRRLRHREQAAFMMRFVQGMEAAEIAGALGVSEPTARRSFSRAHRLVSKWAQHDPFLVDYVPT